MTDLPLWSIVLKMWVFPFEGLQAGVSLLCKLVRLGGIGVEGPVSQQQSYGTPLVHLGLGLRAETPVGEPFPDVVYRLLRGM